MCIMFCYDSFLLAHSQTPQEWISFLQNFKRGHLSVVKVKSNIGIYFFQKPKKLMQWKIYCKNLSLCTLEKRPVFATLNQINQNLFQESANRCIQDFYIKPAMWSIQIIVFRLDCYCSWLSLIQNFWTKLTVLSQCASCAHLTTTTEE